MPYISTDKCCHRIDRLPSDLSAQIPKRHVDSGKREIACHDPIGPKPAAIDIARDRFTVPGAAAKNVGCHRGKRRNDRGCIGTAASFTPANQSAVGGQLHDNVGDAAAIYPGASFDGYVGHTDRKSLEACVGFPDRVPAVDALFHNCIYRASHNLLLQHFGKLIARLHAAQVVLTNRGQGSFELGLPLHREVTEAIAARNPVASAAASHALCYLGYQKMIESLGPSYLDGFLGPST